MAKLILKYLDRETDQIYLGKIRQGTTGEAEATIINVGESDLEDVRVHITGSITSKGEEISFLDLAEVPNVVVELNMQQNIYRNQEVPLVIKYTPKGDEDRLRVNFSFEGWHLREGVSQS